VSAEQSPTGVPELFFGGAHSGTMPFWEFECANPLNHLTNMDLCSCFNQYQKESVVNSSADHDQITMNIYIIITVP